MRFNDPQSPWYQQYAKRIRRHRRATFIYGAITLVLIAGSIAFLAIAAVLTLIGVAFTAADAIAWYQMRQRFRALRQHEGQSCPLCHVAMPADDHDVATCPKCGRTASTADLETYAEQSISLPGEAMRWFQAYRRQRPQGGNRASTASSRAAWRVGWPVVAIVVIAAFSGLTQNRTLLGSFVHLAPWVVWGAVVGLLGSRIVPALLRRAGEERACRACTYQMPPDDPAPTRCPECGADLTRRGSIVTRPAHKRSLRQMMPAMVCGALLLGWISLAFPMMPRLQDWRVRVLPTSTLLRQVELSRLADEEIAELRTRALTPDDDERLGRALLDHDLRYVADADAMAWTIDTMKAGRLPRELRDDLLRQIVQPRLIAIRGGPDAIDVLPGCHLWTLHGPSTGLLYLHGTIRLNGRPVHGTHTTALLDPGITAPTHTLTPPPDLQTRAPMTVDCRVWVVYGPDLTPGLPVTWNADGTPNLPEGVRAMIETDVRETVW